MECEKIHFPQPEAGIVTKNIYLFSSASRMHAFAQLIQLSWKGCGGTVLWLTKNGSPANTLLSFFHNSVFIILFSSMRHAPGAPHAPGPGRTGEEGRRRLLRRAGTGFFFVGHRKNTLPFFRLFRKRAQKNGKIYRKPGYCFRICRRNSSTAAVRATAA